MDSGKHKCIHLPEESRSDHVLMLSAFSLTKAMAMSNNSDCFKSRCIADGYDWEIRFYPARLRIGFLFFAGLELAFLGEARTSHGVTATLTGRLEIGHESCGLDPLEEKALSATFHDPSSPTLLTYIGSWMATDEQFLRQPSPLYIEFTITVIKETMEVGDHHQMPSPDLHRHLGELLQSTTGADVTFAVSGESFAAHRSIIAARSPVFKAEFFGEMQESSSSSSQRVVVEVNDMEADVFKAMLAFVYTDTVPELDEQQGGRAETVVAQHLLVAADRYGLDRLKAICERRLSVCMEVGTVATTLALAEQHNCSQLKDDCIEFIAGGSPEDLEAVLETDGYKHLEASSPSVLTELLKKSVHGKRRRQ